MELKKEMWETCLSAGHLPWRMHIWHFKPQFMIQWRMLWMNWRLRFMMFSGTFWQLSCATIVGTVPYKVHDLFDRKHFNVYVLITENWAWVQIITSFIPRVMTQTIITLLIWRHIAKSLSEVVIYSTVTLHTHTSINLKGREKQRSEHWLNITALTYTGRKVPGTVAMHYVWGSVGTLASINIYQLIFLSQRKRNTDVAIFLTSWTLDHSNNCIQ